MGGAADAPQRASSPMKRRASEFENEHQGQKEDVEMKTESNNPVALPSRHIAVQAYDTQSTTDAEESPSPERMDETKEDQDANLEVPSIDEQIQVVTDMIKEFGMAELKSGTLAWFVSNHWLARVQARGSGAKAKPEDLEGEIGPIDNSDIIEQILDDPQGLPFVQLKPGTNSTHFQILPEKAWLYILKLYGLAKKQFPIVRVAYNTNDDPDGLPNVEFELYPLVFRVHRLWSEHSPVPLPQILKAKHPKPPVIVMSRTDPYVDLLRNVKKAASLETQTKVRVWRLVKALPSGELPRGPQTNELSPPDSREASPVPDASWDELLVDIDTFNKLEKESQRELVETNDPSANANYNGHKNIQQASLGMDATLVLDEMVEKTDYISQYVPKNVRSGHQNVRGKTLNDSGRNSGRNSPAPSGSITRGRSQKSGRTLGCVGLANLGNTCYMNSALQCVRSVEELTKYFLTDEASEELNRDNPLGNNGEIAIAYGNLLREIYKDSAGSSVTPRPFKSCIGRYAPSFSGYGQQDSQEFLGFLLDGLQEDLSRIKKKPYIEKPDSTDEMVNNPDAIREMAAKVWDITKKRDDSVIADLFTGMYKSTLVCPTCSKVSITFDPFNNLTLQLPIESIWTHDVTYYPLNDRPITIRIDLNKQSSVKEFTEYVSKRVGVPIERLLVAEEFKSKFYKIFNYDMKPVSEEISANDTIMVHELEADPTNYPPPPKPTKQKKVKSMVDIDNIDQYSDDDALRWDGPLSERLLVPVIHRRPFRDSRNSYSRKKWENCPAPHFIILTPKEARDHDVIQRKILEKVATFSTHPAFTEEESSASPNDNIDPDLIVTTASDADSSGDGKVIATSVDGEDDVVDVTMNDSNSIRPSIEQDESTSAPAPRGIKRPGRPKWLDPREFLLPDLQQMFTMTYFPGGTDEQLPTGWNKIEDDRDYPPLSTRLPVEPEKSDEEHDGYALANESPPSGSSNTDVEDDETPQMVQTRMNEESSEDELAGNPVIKSLPLRSGKKSTVAGFTGGRNRHNKTYSKKGAKHAAKMAAMATADRSYNGTSDEGPLIRLHEGILVDWTADAWNALFNSAPGDLQGGEPTYHNLEVLEDPELEARRKARQQRRKKGLTLDECLDEFGKEEILSEMDTWYCPRCKEHRRASKKFELWKTPDILVMHLKRFSSSAVRRDKLDIEVDFPIEGLDLSSRVMEKEDGKVEIYDLFAVDDHWGGLGGGHYTAFAKSFVDGEWYEYNDSSVSKQKDTSRIVSHGAYLLFYRRRSLVPLGGPRFREIVDRYNNPVSPTEDESAGSGEDQRLDAASSLRGSSSALTGVGAIHPADGSGGIQRSKTGGVMLSNTVEPLPAYTSFEAGSVFGPQNLLNNDSDMYLEDEGIDMGGMNYNNLSDAMAPKWDFPSHASRLSAASETHSDIADVDFDVDGRSDVVQNNSSASEGSIQARLADFDAAEPDRDEWVEENYVPDADEETQAGIMSIHRDLLEQGMVGGMSRGALVTQVGLPSVQSYDGDEAAEIHVEEGEGLKMD